MTKSVGGRGHKAENKYERFTATIDPALLARLDAFAAERDLPRSEALSKLLDRGLKFTKGGKKQDK